MTPVATVILAKSLVGTGRWDRIEIILEDNMIRRGSAIAKLCPQEFVLARCLVGSAPHGACLSRAELVDALFGDRADGGPDNAESALGKLLCQLRSKLSPIGLSIPCEYSIGWRCQIHDDPLPLMKTPIVRPCNRWFRSNVEHLYREIAAGRCENALLRLDAMYPAYRLADIERTEVAA